nr:MAG TPA: hypothetical protein [Caudoviricetes sp.]
MGILLPSILLVYPKKDHKETEEIREIRFQI